jgi:hypothetical protein
MTDDSIPTLIGPKSNQYVLDRAQLLGDGHSGQVYAGWKASNKALLVAIKLDKTSGAKHEWAMLKKMQGSGVPKVHYTGARAAPPCADAAGEAWPAAARAGGAHRPTRAAHARARRGGSVARAV